MIKFLLAAAALAPPVLVAALGIWCASRKYEDEDDVEEIEYIYVEGPVTTVPLNEIVRSTWDADQNFENMAEYMATVYPSRFSATGTLIPSLTA